MSGPAGVSNAAVGVKGLAQVERVAVDQLLELSNFADLLEGVHLIFLVAIDGETGRVVPTVLETGQACKCRENRR